MEIAIQTKPTNVSWNEFASTCSKNVPHINSPSGGRQKQRVDYTCILHAYYTCILHVVYIYSLWSEGRKDATKAVDNRLFGYSNL